MADSMHLARIHSAAFAQDRAWDADEFATLLETPHCHAVHKDNGFALIRVIADEAELLTLAVHPDDQRHGLGGTLLSRSLALATELGAARMFLEVAADNTGALNLYQQHGFDPVGRRTAYYARPSRPPVDALLLSRALP